MLMNVFFFIGIRLTRKLTSSADYFRDLTEKWYLLFSHGPTSTFIRVDSFSKVDPFSFKPLPDKDHEHVLVQLKRQAIHLQVRLV